MNEQITNWEIKSEEKHADGNACNFFVTSILVTTCKVIYKQEQWNPNTFTYMTITILYSEYNICLEIWIYIIWLLVPEGLDKYELSVGNEWNAKNNSFNAQLRIKCLSQSNDIEGENYRFLFERLGHFYSEFQWSCMTLEFSALIGSVCVNYGTMELLSSFSPIHLLCKSFV